MAIRHTVNILEELKKAGYTSYRLRKDKIFGESTIQRFRDGGQLDWLVLDKLCSLLGCQPGDLIEYKEDEA